MFVYNNLIYIFITSHHWLSVIRLGNPFPITVVFFAKSSWLVAATSYNCAV